MAFVLLQDLKSCSEGPLIPQALSALHSALQAVPAGAYVLSSIAGAILVVPDDISWSLEQMLGLLRQVKTGFPLRVGVTHGTVEVVVDVDGEKNLIGEPINIAARLAASPDNPGALLHESYLEPVASILPLTHSLHPKQLQEISTRVKPHDPPYRCFVAQETFPALPPEGDVTPEWRSAVLIAYDLPKFSGGDRAELRKRFTRLGQVFKKLAPAPALLSPAGDGGVLVLPGINLTEAAQIATRLRDLTEIESIGHDGRIAVKIRIGVHYGKIAEYTSARGISRPAGMALFVADEIAGDDHARQQAGIIVTKLIAESMAGGSREQLAADFAELPLLAKGPAAGVGRRGSPSCLWTN